VKYNFLNQSNFVIVDYVPGSSGQLFLRLWSELDSRLNYNNDTILTEAINENPASTEVDYDIQVPKKIVNWFLEKAEPSSVDEYLSFFEYLGNFLTATGQRWNHSDTKTKFFENGKDINYNDIVLYGMHTKHVTLPLHKLKVRAPKLNIISIVPETSIGREYQYKRACACYSKNKQNWNSIIETFNKKSHMETFDFCTLLATKETKPILLYFQEKIPPAYFLTNKVQKVDQILKRYYTTVVDNLGLSTS
jgi:hypothetical protein